MATLTHLPVEILYFIGEQDVGIMNGLVRTIPSVRERLYRPNMKEAFVERFTTVKKTVESVEWTFNGRIHRDGDSPAVEYADGNKEWYQHGLIHRDGDLPAVECDDGTKMWYQYGERHRDGDLPAIERVNGGKEWWKYGERHRDGDLPAVEWNSGTKVWYHHGELYYRDGYLPAIEWPELDRINTGNYTETETCLLL